MDLLIVIYLFIIGTIVGSFINVVVYRSGNPPKKNNYRSFCPDCGTTLKAFDLIPLISYLFLKGKCRYCQRPISLRYFLGELVTGILFAFTWLHINQFSLDLVFFLSLVSILTALFFTDLYYGILPDKIVILGVVITLFYWVLTITDMNTLLLSAAAAFVTSLFFFAIVYFSNGRAMGGGDVKLAFLMGLVLGWPKIAPALLLAFLTGAFLSVMLIALKVKKFGQTVPFGPFLTLGTLISLFWGNQIIDWYLKFLLHG